MFHFNDMLSPKRSIWKIKELIYFPRNVSIFGEENKKEG